LIHVLDGLSEDPVEDFHNINGELDMFDERLGALPQIVVLNKMDLPEVAARFEPLRGKLRDAGVELLPVSAVSHLNLKEILWKAWRALQEIPVEPIEETLPVYRSDEDPDAFEIEQTEEGWVVSGKRIERAAAMTYFDQPGSVRRFQKFLAGIGVDKALRKAGIQEGESVFIGDWELIWQD